MEPVGGPRMMLAVIRLLEPYLHTQVNKYA